jgi:protein SCO1/2
MLCTMVLNGLVGALETMNFNAGREFEVVAVSFDSGETPAMASAKKAQYITRYGRHGAEAGFRFLTGREASIQRLTAAVRFHYTYDPAIDQFAHPAAITVLTPDGKVSRYLYGIDYPPRDLRLALVEAADRKIGSLVDQALLYCYHYDPVSGRYGLAIMTLVRIGGILTLVVLGASIWRTLRRDRRLAWPAAAARTR